MTTARRLIYDGLREGNIIPANTSLSATDAQNSELLPKLNIVMYSLLGEIIGEEPKDWSVPPLVAAGVTPPWNDDPNVRSVEQQPIRCASNSSDTTYQYPPQNSRLIIRALENPLTVYLPPEPNDGALMQLVDLDSTTTLTLDANGRFIEDAATVTLDPVSSYNGKTLLYRGDQGNWRFINDFTIDSDSPLPSVFDDLLSIGVYFFAAPRNGSTPATTTVSRYTSLLKKMQRRYRQSQPNIPPAASPRPSMQEYRGIFLTGR